MAIFVWLVATAFCVIFCLLKFVIKKAEIVVGDGRVDGKAVVITGGNTGIGLQTALELATRGAAIIIIGCRDIKKGEVAVAKIREAGNASLDVKLFYLDLGSLESVKKFAGSVQNVSGKIDILVNNAGVMIGESESTSDGFEVHMGVNHLGHFLLTHLLEESLLKAAQDVGEARIVNVSSDGHKFALFSGLDVDHPRFGHSDWAFDGWFKHHRMYGQSKLAQIYHTRQLHKRLFSKGIVSMALHPGMVKTEITRYHQAGLGFIATLVINFNLNVFGKSLVEGTKTTLHCCVADDVKNVGGGKYFVDAKPVDIFPWLVNDRKEEMLWTKSEKLVGITP